MTHADSPVATLLTALADALEYGTASLDTDRTFTIITSDDTFEIDGLVPRFIVSGIPIVLSIGDRLCLHRFRRRIRRKNAQDNRAYLSTVAHRIVTHTHAHRQQSTPAGTDD